MNKTVSAALCLVAFCLVHASAYAVDFRVKGQWMINMELGKYGQFAGEGYVTGFSNRNGGDDDFGASQRTRLQLEAVASEKLSGTVFLEMGNIKWGRGSQGGALGADGGIVELKNAYIDAVFFEGLRARMGIQNVTLPSYSTTSQIMSADVAAITLNYAFNDHIAATAWWLRPWNDNYAGNAEGTQASYLDNVDFFGLALPMDFDGVKITPWGMYGMLGPNAFRNENSWIGRANANYYSSGLYPIMYGNMADRTQAQTSYGNAWWAGFTGEVTTFAPWRFAWDFNYGSFRRDDEALNREGWLVSALVEYKLDWGVPGIHGWYASGDDDDPSNGSERLPYTNLDEGGANSFDKFAFGGGRPNTFRDSRIAHSMAGTWGLGLYLRDLSFMEDLKHTFRANYIGGTNDPDLLKALRGISGEWMSPNNLNGNTLGMEGLYLTSRDGAISFNLDNEWKVYENFKIFVDAAYIHLMLDKSSDVWGQSGMNGKSDSVYDAWNVSCTFMYSF